MSENCTHDCSTCGESCSERKEETDFRAHLNEQSSVNHIIGIVSGKGGVGKSLVTSLLAITMNRRGHKTAILDADITGPSIPKMFGLTQKVENNGFGMVPVSSKTGIDVMSVNLLLQNDSDPVVWRGPMIAGVVKQFYEDVIWQDIDYMFVDMPPGTGDVPLTVFQSLPLNGIIIVSTPQELVSMIVKKAVKMANMMNIPILGIVENMSYFKCPDCGSEHRIFGDSNIEETAKAYGTKVLGRLPMDPKFSISCDKGAIELYNGDFLEGAVDILEESEK
ncbi:MAG: Mrp/NBP35 family ATP-binding protein [Bacillota bacterium]|nr:Mrp/NBP35 family ATP-binding protein [Bacillota bacterium]